MMRKDKQNKGKIKNITWKDAPVSLTGRSCINNNILVIIVIIMMMMLLMVMMIKMIIMMIYR